MTSTPGSADEMIPAYLIGTSPKSSLVTFTVPPVFGSQIAFALATSVAGVAVVQTLIVTPAKLSAAAEGLATMVGAEVAGAADVGAFVACGACDCAGFDEQAARNAAPPARIVPFRTSRLVTRLA